MRHCGNCGAPIDPDSFDGRTCPWCGAAISSTGDILSGETNVSDSLVQQSTNFNSHIITPRSQDTTPTSPAHVSVDSRTIFREDATMRPGTRSSLPLKIAIPVLVGLLLLACGSATLLYASQGAQMSWLPFLGGGASHSDATNTASASSSSGGPSTPGNRTGSGSSDGSGGTGAGGSASPTAIGGSGGSSTATPGDATATPSGAPTATITPPVGSNPPVLSVSPTTITLNTLCVNARAQFTVANTGGGTLSWSASTSSTYSVSPQSDSLGAGQHETVSVDNILTATGKVTVMVSASGASGSPQTVSIKCLL